MSHPLRFLDRNFRKVRRGSSALAAQTVKLRETIREMILRVDLQVAKALSAEIFRRVLRQLVMTAIELSVGLFVRKVSTPPRPTIVRPFPAPRSAS
jgi:hypothetical protein